MRAADAQVKPYRKIRSGVNGTPFQVRPKLKSAESRSEIGFPCGFPYGFPGPTLEAANKEPPTDSEFPREPLVSWLSARFSERFSKSPRPKFPTDQRNAARQHPKSGRGQVRQKGGSDPPSWAALRPRPSGLRGSLPPSAYCETQCAPYCPRPSEPTQIVPRKDSTHRANLLFFAGLVE